MTDLSPKPKPPVTATGAARPLTTIGTLLLLALILLVGGYFRFMSLNWDDFAALHPDERFLTVNLLPIIGGANEFTPDREHFPSQSIIMRLGDQSANTTLDIQINPLMTIGAQRNSRSADLVGWWVGEGRLQTYASQDEAVAALLAGEVNALAIPEAQVATLSSTLVRSVGNFRSEAVQRIHCNARHPDTDGRGGYFDTYCSPLNPHNAGAGAYAYGTWPLFLSHWISDMVYPSEPGAPSLLTFEGQTLIWRFLSAFFDVGSIAVIFLIGSRLHNRWVGLAAAILYACAPLAIQKAHFGTVNSITAFFVMLALWAAVHVQERGSFAHYLTFGLALGAALAGRINVIPLAGVVVLAGMVNAAPVLDHRIPWIERERLLWRNIIGVFIAGFSTIIAFRLMNPYAFTGPSFWHMIPNGRWLADAQNSSFNVSGASDIPPNWQWLGRPSYLYPLKDMIFWGMGVAMGVLAWLGFTWSGYRLIRGREFALRNVLLLAWVAVYFAWIGGLWVMTMRYYLPLYGALALFAGWMLVELVRQAHQRGKDLPLTRVLLMIFGAFFAGIPVYYAYSGAMTVTATTAGVLGLGLFGVALVPRFERRGLVLAAFVIGFTGLWALMFTNIYRQQSTRVQAARWVWENVSGDFSMRVEGAPDGTPLINLAIGNSNGNSADSPDDLPAAATRYTPGLPNFADFVSPATGTITHIHAPHLGDPLDDPEPEALYFSLARRDDGLLLYETVFEQDLVRDDHPLGVSYDIVFDEPIQVTEGVAYTLKVESVSDEIIGAGEVMLTEGTWDDRITTIMTCHLPQGITLADNPAPGMVAYADCNGLRSAYALLQSYDLAMSYPVDGNLRYNNAPDDDVKYRSLVDGLGAGDYLAITSNRFYDTEPRNPARFPVATAYYDLLFSGELGYDLIATFREGYEFGALSVDDQHLPIYDSPAWFNELEADEAFHVYDHPVVFIFRKSDDYDHARTQVLLDVPRRVTREIGLGPDPAGAQIADLVYWETLQADQAPTALMQPPDVRERNQQGGTWSERFDSDSPINTSQALGVVVFWLTIIGIGWVTWPLVFAAFPRLADGGFAVSKIIGLLLTGWTAWLAASFKLPMWSQGGLLIVLLLLAGLSAYLAIVRREALRDFLSEHWRRLLLIELLTLTLFLILIGVRLTNPDLWHHPMGGEKPMDFAFFNAVLRTSVFPPPDPWYAGGFINYYYFGYVITGVPVLLLKLVPSFAYNLLVPTVFALTGIGAFSAAFNIVAAWSSRRVIASGKASVVQPMGNPWVAGTAAMLLCVILGNLDSPRVLIEEGIAPLGGYTRPTGLEDYLVERYIAENGESPDPATLVEIQERANRGYLSDEIAYEVSIRAELVNGFVNGIGRVLAGEPLRLGSNRWYWAPTRVIMETPEVGGYAIAEFPYFTFLYGDLHAHMISMPLMLFALLFVFYEVQHAPQDRRTLFAHFAAIFLGALAIGMMRATNTWDWPSFMIFGVVGLGYAWWRRFETISRESLAYLVVYIGGFMMLAAAVVAPYAGWYSAVYNNVKLWEGGRTPLWAYWNIYGLFLFLIVSMFIWETARWLRETRVSALAGYGNLLLAGGLAIGALLIAALVGGFMGYHVALIVVPLIIWIVLLFFRPGQSAAMQVVLVAIGFSLALTLAVEIVVLDGDIGRQNTVFKFYIQVWLLLSVAAGAAFAWVIQRTDQWRVSLEMLWFGVLLFLTAAAAMYPVTATRARMVDRFVPDLPLTLDGLDYMAEASYFLPRAGEVITLENDYHIIRWLQENVEGTPYIMEGRSVVSEYHYNGRIAINTGLPTVVGWANHQRQQRSLDPLPNLVNQRQTNVQHFYNTVDINSAVDLLRQFDVSYIIVSDMERALYPESSLAKFEHMIEFGLLERAFESGEAVVYHVLQSELDAYAVQHQALIDALDIEERMLPSFVSDSGLPDDITVNPDLNADAALRALDHYEAEFIAITNPPRLRDFEREAYERLLYLENLGVLLQIDDRVEQRLYRVDQAQLQAVLEENR